MPGCEAKLLYADEVSFYQRLGERYAKGSKIDSIPTCFFLQKITELNNAIKENLISRLSEAYEPLYSMVEASKQTHWLLPLLSMMFHMIQSCEYTRSRLRHQAGLKTPLLNPINQFCFHIQPMILSWLKQPPSVRCGCSGARFNQIISGDIECGNEASIVTS